jgi:hypothetical protein
MALEMQMAVLVIVAPLTMRMLSNEVNNTRIKTNSKMGGIYKSIIT